MTLLKYNEIDFKKINYNKPEKQGNYYYSSMNYKNEPLHIQTPKMICKSNGLEVLLKKTSTIDSETMNHDFSFYDFLLNLDDRNIKETFKSNKTWFGKEIPLEIIDDMYKRIAKPVKKEEKPQFSFKLPVIKEKVQCPIFDQNKICLDIQKVIPDCEIIFVLHVRGLKFLKQHYYCDCYISQIKITTSKDQKYSVLNEYLIDDEGDIENDYDDIIDDEIVNRILEAEKKKTERKLELEKLLQEKQNEIENIQKELNNF
tara:strand:+ start:450 stop:1223 length:774 start_codon:yes stop_codon:yes gene_type:complete